MTDAPSPPPVVLHADPAECPCRTDAYAARHLEDVSRSRVHALMDEGRVRVNGVPVKAKRLLQGGERIEIDIPPPPPPVPDPEEVPLDVLYEDDDVVVIDKPAGMVVHPGAGRPSGTLVNALLGRYGRLSSVGGASRPGIVHRLDRGTSGCMAVARTDAAHHGLTRQLADRSMGRTYAAWVMGEMPGPKGAVDAPIGRSFRNRTRMAVVRRGGRRGHRHR